MDLKKTITTIFVVPTLKINRDALKNHNFINGYIKDVRKDVQYKDAVYLLFRPKNLDQFRYFLDEEYERTDQIVDDYDYEDGFVVLVYTLSKDFKEDFELIKKGKYSLTSEKFKRIFPKTIQLVKNGVTKEENSLQYRIFIKSDDLREYWENKLAVDFKEDMEVWDGWTEENEMMNLDKIKELV